jgi:hypothetical protein
MMMPRFTAEASLYKTNERYRTGTQVGKLFAQTISAINPSMINTGGVNCGNCVGGECAELHCFENWVQSGAPPGGPYQEGMENPPWFPGGGFPGESGGTGCKPPKRPNANYSQTNCDECYRICAIEHPTEQAQRVCRVRCREYCAPCV